MNSEESPPVQPAPLAASYRVSLSPYVNEQFPNWEEMLSVHDVARLARRPRWMVLSLALLGRFPQKRRFHSPRDRLVAVARAYAQEGSAHHTVPYQSCDRYPLTGRTSETVAAGLHAALRLHASFCRESLV